MVNDILDAKVQKLSRLVREKMGLNFSNDRFKDFIRGLTEAARELDFDNMESYIDFLLRGGLDYNQQEDLAIYLTIGETYFFRDEKMFSTLKYEILPQIINNKKNSNKRINIWSAGCSTGEEPYSIAILLYEMLPEIESWDINIIATDINDKSIEKAKMGLYTEWSFRELDMGFKQRYFEKTPEKQYRINAKIKKIVRFTKSNLITDIYNNMDMILCRNVFIYFDNINVSRVIKNFYSSLVDDGYLFVAPSESFHVPNDKFLFKNRNGIFAYQKISPQKMQTAEINMTEGTLNQINLTPFSKYKDKYDYVNTLDFNASISGVDNEQNESNIKEYNDNSQKFQTKAKNCADAGKLVEACEWCKKAIECDKLNPASYVLLSSIFQELGQIENAIASLEKAIYIQSDYIIAYFQLGNLYQMVGDKEAAKKNFNNAMYQLDKLNKDDIVTDSDGITVGTLSGIINRIIKG